MGEKSPPGGQLDRMYEMKNFHLMARMLERCWRRRKVVTRPVARRQNATNPENISSPSILYLVI